MQVVYEFVASGHNAVIDAYESIDKAAERSKRVAEGAGRAIGPRATPRGGMRSRVDSELSREIQAVERAEARKRAAVERSQRHVAGIRDRHFREEQRREEADARRRERTLDRMDARVSQARARTAAKEQAQRERSRSQSVETLKDLGSGAILGATGTIAAVIGAATKEAMSLQEQANRISINARKSGEGFQDAGALRRSFERTAIETPGTKASDVADAVQRFISLTGDVSTATMGQGVFAKVASATGGNIGDVAEASASLSQQFDIKSLEDMKEALAALTFQGKEGAFELKDAAAQFQRLAAAGAAFGIPKGVQGVKTLGGLTQIARTGTGSAEQAATAVENLLTNLKLKGRQLGSAGVDVFDKEGKARDVRDVVTEAIAKVGGTDIARKQMGLSQIFGEQGIRAINPLIAKYNEAFRGATGSEEERTAAAMGVLREEFRRSIDAAGDWDDVLEDSAQATKSASAQLDASWERIKASVGDKVLPAFANLVEKVAGEDGGAGALDPFIEATGLAAEALGTLVDAIGLKKEKPLTQQAEEAAQKLRRFDRKQQETIGPLTPEEAAKRDEIEASLKAAQEKIFRKDGGALSEEEFIKRYQAAGAEGSTKTGAEMVARAVKEDSGGVFTNDFFQRNFMGETQAQTDLRRQFAGDTMSQKMTGELDTEEAQKAIRNLAAASNSSAEAIGKALASLNQGTIFAGS